MKPIAREIRSRSRKSRPQEFTAQGLEVRSHGLPWKRLAGAALVAGAGAAGALFTLSTINLAQGAADTCLRLGAGWLSLAGGLLGLMEFHKRRTGDIARGRVVEPAAADGRSPSSFRMALGLAAALLAVATVLATTVDVAVQASLDVGTPNRRSGLEALMDAQARRDREAAGREAAEQEELEGNPKKGIPGLLGPDPSRRPRGAVSGEALGNLLSDRPVFRVFDETDPKGPGQTPLLLRGFVVQGFDDSGALRERSGNSVGLSARGTDGIDHIYSDVKLAQEGLEGRVFDLRFQFFGASRGLIFSPHELVHLDAAAAELNRGTLALTAVLEDPQTYSLRARVPIVGARAAKRARASGSLPEDDLTLALPPVLTEARRRANERLDRLAKSITRDSQSDMDRVLSVVQHLRSSFAYELYHVDFLNPEGCVELLDRGAGSCTHFASMATLLLRRIDIPTRIAAGYVAREPLANGEAGWTVRERDGHAWIEVHFQGLGWLPFDPTPGDATVGGALSGWSPLDPKLERGTLGGGAGAATTGLAALARTGFQAIQELDAWVRWLFAGLGAAALLWTLGRRRGPAPYWADSAEGGQPRAASTQIPEGRSSDPPIAGLFEALRERGHEQPVDQTPRAFARSVEQAMPGARGLEGSILVLLRAAAGRGAIEPHERATIRELAGRIEGSADDGE